MLFFQYFLDFAIYGRWEAVHSLKMLSWGVGTFSNTENFILRTLIFGLFWTLSRPSRQVGLRLTCWMSSRSGDPANASKLTCTGRFAVKEGHI